MCLLGTCSGLVAQRLTFTKNNHNPKEAEPECSLHEVPCQHWWPARLGEDRQEHGQASVSELSQGNQEEEGTPTRTNTGSRARAQSWVCDGGLRCRESKSRSFPQLRPAQLRQINWPVWNSEIHACDSDVALVTKHHSKKEKDLGVVENWKWLCPSLYQNLHLWHWKNTTCINKWVTNES